MKQTANENVSRSLFLRPFYVSLFALTAAIVWGWAYPLIKLGYAEFAITTDMTASKLLFAGVRFFLSGLIVLSLAGHARRSFAVRRVSDWWYIMAFTMLNTTLHYAFFYFGLSHSLGSRASILNSLSVFSVVILACVFFPTDKFTLRKMLGCALGFTGILLLNVGGESATVPTMADFWLGDGMIIMNALCGAGASLMTRGLAKRVDVFVGTGYSLAIGGFLLILPALVMGGVLPQVTLLGILYLLLLIAISSIGFSLYNKLLTCNPVGKVAIYNSLIPVVGAITSCLCLHEPFTLRYLLAALLAAIGIYVINRGKK